MTGRSCRNGGGRDREDGPEVDLEAPRDGGAEGIRTPDLLIANETLYQLSYDPATRAGE